METKCRLKLVSVGCTLFEENTFVRKELNRDFMKTNGSV